MRLPEGDVPAQAGAGVSKSAASRHFVALSARAWRQDGCGSARLDIMVVQIDGIHIREHLVLVAALGIDSEGIKHPLGLIEGATEHSAVVQALIDDLIERGLDPAVPRLFIIDGSKALAKAIRRSFGHTRPAPNPGGLGVSPLRLVAWWRGGARAREAESCPHLPPGAAPPGSGGGPHGEQARSAGELRARWPAPTSSKI